MIIRGHSHLLYGFLLPTEWGWGSIPILYFSEQKSEINFLFFLNKFNILITWIMNRNYSSILFSETRLRILMETKSITWLMAWVNCQIHSSSTNMSCTMCIIYLFIIVLFFLDDLLMVFTVQHIQYHWNLKYILYKKW